jgi:hypothetical protein
MTELIFAVLFGIPILWLLYLPFQIMAKADGWSGRVFGLVLLAAEVLGVYYLARMIEASMSTF